MVKLKSVFAVWLRTRFSNTVDQWLALWFLARVIDPGRD